MKNWFEIGLKVLAVALLGAAVYFYSTDESDRCFASAVLAACSYFLSLRFRFKAKIVPAPAAGEDHVEAASEDQ